MSLYEDLTEILTPYADKINQNTASLNDLRDDLDNLDVETDKTLSVDGKPADGKAVGDGIADLKADLNDMSFVAETVKGLDTYNPVHTDEDITSTLETGKYYSGTNSSIGSVITTDQSNNVNYDCGLFEVNKGDVYVVTGRTASASRRIWCFTDANYKLLSGAELDSALILTNEVITAPANGYLFINVRNNSNRKIIKRTTTSTSLHEKITEIEGAVSENTDAINGIVTADATDEGKFLQAKTITDGKVTEWEFGEAGGDASELGTLVNSMNDFGTVSEDIDKTADFVTGYYPADGAVGSAASTTLNTNSNYKGIYVAVSAGETVTLSAKGNSHTTYAFTDANFVILSKSGYEAYTDELLTAPTDGYLFVTTQHSFSYKLILHKSETVTLHDKMNEVDGAIAEVDAKFDNLPEWIATNILSGNTPWNESERTATGTGGTNSISSISAGISSDDYTLDGDVIYLSVMAKASGNPTKLVLAHGSTAPNIESAIQNLPTADTWYRLSSIDRQVSATVRDYRYVAVHAYYADSTAQNGQTLTYKCGLAFNLTTIFGKGNEPTEPTIIDAMLSRYENGWFSGSQDIWNPSMIKWLAESYKSYMNGTYYGSDGKRFVAGSIIDRNDDQWDHAQASYGLSANLVPVDNKFEGGIRTNGMVNVFPKYGRWERGAAGADSGSLFGGHVFEAWNNIRSYRLTMMMGHGGDEVSYTDENNVVHKTPREDEACIIVYSPANSYANPPVTPTEEQSKLRINKAQEDYYGDNAQNLLGRIRIGGDTPTQGTVFTKNKMITYGRIILADTTKVNTGKALKFNSDGTVTWEEVTLYQNPEPAPTE